MERDGNNLNFLDVKYKEGCLFDIRLVSQTFVLRTVSKLFFVSSEMP